jgi:predicted O-methyltransferase YrrM
MAMRPVSDQLLDQIDDYVENLFVPPDAALEQNLRDADAAGLPAIAISPGQGRFVYLLAKIAGAKRILEIGTLGGYSTTCLARALPDDGKVVTLELSPEHAAVARKNLDRAGIGGRVEIRIGSASDTLDKMIVAGEASFDFVFIDADKPGYVGYLNQVLQLSHPGTVIVGDNLIRHGDVLAEVAPDEQAVGVKAFNALIASHPRLESILLPILKDKIDGMSISRVK